MIKVQTVCWIVNNKRILLGSKKRGLKAGCWNGFGGKLEEGETALECITRETREEAGINLNDAEELGIGKFHNYELDYIIEVHFYKCTKFSGKPVSTEEMEPKWFTLDEIPYDNMWPSDQYILPIFLKDQKFSCEFWFNRDGSIGKFDVKKV